jgi:uncharacterized protein with GYD domain
MAQVIGRRGCIPRTLVRHGGDPVEPAPTRRLLPNRSPPRARLDHADDPLPEGVETIKNNPQRIREVNAELEQLGATVKAQWATLGRFDFVNVVEAPDDRTMARVSMELGSRGTARYESLTAIPIDDFISSL